MFIYKSSRRLHIQCLIPGSQCEGVGGGGGMGESVQRQPWDMKCYALLYNVLILSETLYIVSQKMRFMLYNYDIEKWERINLFLYSLIQLDI